jgi:large subunit ribosomal protein L23
LITEKNQLLQDKENKYVFEVARYANKLEIKQAIEDIFDVRVESVRTMRMQGKIKRMGRFEGRRANWKKAIVKLTDGDVIDLFTGA